MSKFIAVTETRNGFAVTETVILNIDYIHGMYSDCDETIIFFNTFDSHGERHNCKVKETLGEIYKKITQASHGRLIPQDSIRVPVSMPTTITGDDLESLHVIYDLLCDKYKNSPTRDYMVQFRKTIDKLTHS